MSLLLTLTTASLQSMLDPKADPPRTLLDVPDYVINTLDLRGLNINASMLSGWGVEDLDRLRDRADKAACPCLVLFEEEPLPFGDEDDEAVASCKDRVERLAFAAHRLGCNALALRCQGKAGGPAEDELLERAAEAIRGLMAGIEHLELNLLLAQADGLTSDADRLTELIKKVGGFRIGAMPVFGAGSKEEEDMERLRKLAPYAGAIHVSVEKFTAKGNHKGFDIAQSIATIRRVGYMNTVTIDYVGDGDPSKDIQSARDAMQAAIDAE